MARISIIIPVYNVEDYLAECLDSVLAQTMPDFEAVCVNDGSTDSSLQILKDYAARDGRIKVVSKRNGGLSSARNAGIKRSTGEYLCFLDSDDTLLPWACERICDLMDRDASDVLTFGAIPYPHQDDDDFRYLEMVLSPRDAFYDGFDPKLLFGEWSHPYVWRTAIRSAFLRRAGLMFDESLAFGEDEAFYFALYPRAERVGLSSLKLLNYRANRSGSLMRKKTDPDWKVGAHLEIVDRVLADWAENGFAMQFPLEILKWSCEFLFNDLLRLPDDRCCEYAGRLRELWEECLPAHALGEFSDDPVYCRALDAIAHDPAQLRGLARKKLLADFVRRSCGRKKMIAQLPAILRS